MPVKPKPSPWILREIRKQECCGFWQKNPVPPHYLILHEQTARHYWQFDDDKALSESALASRDYFLTVASDGEVTIKALFFKECLSQFEFDSPATEPSLMASQHDWRHCSIWLTKYCLKVIPPPPNLKTTPPEVVLLVKNFSIQQTAHLDAIDYVSGFMNHCMEFKDARMKARAVHYRTHCITFTASKSEKQEEQRLSTTFYGLYSKKAELNRNPGGSNALNPVNTCEAEVQAQHVNKESNNNENDGVPEPAVQRANIVARYQLRKNPRTVADLWQNCARDLPDWTPLSSGTSSPEVRVVYESVKLAATAANTAQRSSQKSAKPAAHSQKSVIKPVVERNHHPQMSAKQAAEVGPQISAKPAAAERPQTFVAARSVKLQTSTKRTGWNGYGRTIQECGRTSTVEPQRIQNRTQEAIHVFRLTINNCNETGSFRVNDNPQSFKNARNDDDDIIIERDIVVPVRNDIVVQKNSDDNVDAKSPSIVSENGGPVKKKMRMEKPDEAAVVKQLGCSAAVLTRSSIPSAERANKSPANDALKSIHSTKNRSPDDDTDSVLNCDDDSSQQQSGTTHHRHPADNVPLFIHNDISTTFSLSNDLRRKCLQYIFSRNDDEEDGNNNGFV